MHSLYFIASSSVYIHRRRGRSSPSLGRSSGFFIDKVRDVFFSCFSIPSASSYLSRLTLFAPLVRILRCLFARPSSQEREERRSRGRGAEGCARMKRRRRRSGRACFADSSAISGDGETLVGEEAVLSSRRIDPEILFFLLLQTPCPCSLSCCLMRRKSRCTHASFSYLLVCPSCPRRGVTESSPEKKRGKETKKWSLSLPCFLSSFLLECAGRPSHVLLHQN